MDVILNLYNSKEISIIFVEKLGVGYGYTKACYRALLIIAKCVQGMLKVHFSLWYVEALYYHCSFYS